MRVAIYARVSTDEQRERQTIETQIEKAKDFCKLHELEIHDFYLDEGVSGIVPFNERPGGKRLLEDAEKKLFSAVVVYKLDRIGRDIVVIRNLLDFLSKLNIAFRSITEPFDTSTAFGKSFMELLGVFAGFERSMIIERSKAGMERIAKEGKYTGGIVPYGYLVNEKGFYEPDEELIPGLNVSPAEIVRQIYRWLAYEDRTLLWIADKLNSMGVPTNYALSDLRKGKRTKNLASFWRPVHIGRLVRNEFYKGIHRWGKRNPKTGKKTSGQVERRVPALVDVRTWEFAVEAIKRNRNRNRPDHRIYLFSGLIKCGVCGHAYVGSYYKTKDGEVKYYRCAKRHYPRNYDGIRCSNGISVREDKLDSEIWETVKKWLDNPQEAVDELIERERELLEESDKKLKKIQALERELKSLEEKRERASYTFINGFLTKEAYSRIQAEFEVQEKRIKEELQRFQELLKRNQSEQDAVETVMKSLERLKEMVKDRKVVPYELRKAVYRLLIQNILVYEDGHVDVVYAFKSLQSENARSGIHGCNKHKLCREGYAS
ncbi:recombinase family protein [Desulfurobacterium sp.]